jgi:hypothetical protein
MGSARSGRSSRTPGAKCRNLDIQEYTDHYHNPMFPYTVVMAAGLHENYETGDQTKHWPYVTREAHAAHIASLTQTPAEES